MNVLCTCLAAFTTWGLDFGAYAMPARSISLPLAIREDARAGIREVRLYVSTSYGVGWEHVATARPDQTCFRYEALRDGSHWFAVSVVDCHGHETPGNLRALSVGQRVYVGERPPSPLPYPSELPPTNGPSEPPYRPTGRSSLSATEEVRLLWQLVERLRQRVEDLEVWQHPTK